MLDVLKFTVFCNSNHYALVCLYTTVPELCIGFCDLHKTLKCTNLRRAEYMRKAPRACCITALQI
jgi:hypothetical protein